MKATVSMWMRQWRFTFIWFLMVLAGFGTAAVHAGPLQKVTLFAAASTTNAVTDISESFEQSHPVEVRLSFASSSTLAKQIENGAPADILLCANPGWMDYLTDKGTIVAASRSNLLSNRIVLIAPKTSAMEKLTIDTSLDLARLLADGRLAMGDPDHVPAGMYGKQALETLGLWPSVEDKLAPAKDVRAALVLVERGEAPLGQVYATDAAISNKVRVVGMFPENSHPPVIYPVALVKETTAAKAFIDFLKTETSSAIFRKYGFSVR